jgi:hypothetical protein
MILHRRRRLKSGLNVKQRIKPLLLELVYYAGRGLQPVRNEVRDDVSGQPQCPMAHKISRTSAELQTPSSTRCHFDARRNLACHFFAMRNLACHFDARSHRIVIATLGEIWPVISTLGAIGLSLLR